MALSKTYTITTLRNNAVDYISKIPAANIGQAANLDSTFNGGYTWKKNHSASLLVSKTNNRTENKKSLTWGFTLTTNNTIANSLKVAVSTDTVKSQFEKYLDNLKLTENELKGSVVSVRTVQAIAEAMISFIVGRYQIWFNPDGTKSVVLYDSSNSVSYPAITYNSKVVSPSDKLDQAGINDLLGSITTTAVSSIIAKREPYTVTWGTSCSSSSCSSSSCSSSCSSSSSSSSSCSSSCSSSSCSSSSSSFFVVYLKLPN